MSVVDASPAASAPRRRRLRRIAQALAVVLVLGLLLPATPRIPVEGATRADWNAETFWYSPWGRSGVHKGIDIFAPRGRAVVAATPGIVLFRGELRDGGRVVVALGPRWRLHYYAHLEAFAPDAPWLLARGTPLGSVGDSGNAVGKATHLHYSVLSLLPLPWRIEAGPQGWKRAFYLDPDAPFADAD